MFWRWQGHVIKKISKWIEVRGYKFKKSGSVISFESFRSDVKSDMEIECIPSNLTWLEERVGVDMTVHREKIEKWSEVVLTVWDMIGLSEVMTLVMTRPRIWPCVCIGMKTCWERVKLASNYMKRIGCWSVGSSRCILKSRVRMNSWGVMDKWVRKDENWSIKVVNGWE